MPLPDRSKITRSERYALDTTERIASLVANAAFIAELTRLRSDAEPPVPPHPRSGPVCFQTTMHADDARDYTAEIVQAWLLADKSSIERKVRLARLFEYVLSAPEGDERETRREAACAIIDSICSCTEHPTYLGTAFGAEAAHGATPVSPACARGWPEVREQFDAVARRYRHDAQDPQLLLLALGYELPLDLPRLRELVTMPLAEGGFGHAANLLDALCHDVWLRREDVVVADDELRKLSLLRHVAWLDGTDDFHGEDDGARLWLRRIASIARAPKGFMASPAGFPPAFEAGGKRATTPRDSERTDVPPPDEERWPGLPSLELVYREISAGRCTPVLPHAALDRVARAATMLRAEPEYRERSAGWRVLRFHRAPAEDDLRPAKKVPARGRPAWTLYTFDEGFREYARRKNDREVFVPVCVRAFASKRIPPRELVEPIASPIRDSFEAARYRRLL